jgi:putative spermidine/putrescine transport system ATP-binding protein
MATKGSSIEFRSVRKTYGSFVALEDFSMTVAPGEFMTLLGPSGSGKTTALNCLAGFIDIGDGDILIDGVSIARVPTEKRGIGMVFQNYSLFPHRSVMGNVAFPLEMRGMARDEVRRRSLAALEMVRLDGLADRMPHELSGGQKQRVAFARAVVFEPSVLLMDEPLGALDLKLRETLQLEIKQYQRQIGCTVIYVTHDQGEALTLSDRLAVMDKGVIQAARHAAGPLRPAEHRASWLPSSAPTTSSRFSARKALDRLHRGHSGAIEITEARALPSRRLRRAAARSICSRTPQGPCA